MKKTFLWLLGVLFTLTQVLAQDRSVSGLVTDSESGEPLIGVSVVVKGSTVGTATDLDGKYSLNVATGKTLVFTYIGFVTQEVVVGGSSEINVKLASDAVTVQETVITANALNRNKRSVAFANQTVTSEQLNVVTNKSALNALQGKVAGVNITQSSGALGASTRIVLRGEGSLTGGNNALIVVDGIPINNSAIAGGVGDLDNYTDFGNRANDINPDDIESMTILKGPAATSLYGSRGASGVVLITTKSGKGAAKEGKGFKVSLNSSVSFEKPYIVLQRQNKFGQGLERGVQAPWSFDTGENYSWGQPLDGALRPWTSPIEVNGELVQLVKPYSAIDNQIASFFDLGSTFKNGFNVEGGNEKVNYFTSYTNMNANGIVPHTYFKRHSFTANTEAKMSEKLKVNFNINYSKTDQRGNIEGARGFTQASTTPAYFYAMQSPVDIPFTEIRDYNSPYHDFQGYYGSYTANPYFILDKTRILNKIDNLLTTASMTFTPIKSLSFTGRVGNNFINTYTTEEYPKYQYLDHLVLEDGELFERSRESNANAGLYRESTSKINNLTVDLFAQYNKKFGKFDLNFLTGYNSFEARTNQLSGSTVGGLVVPEFYSLSNSIGVPQSANTQTLYRLIGAYVNGNIGYNNMLFLEYSARNDWSSTLPANNRGFFYQAGGISFVPTELLKGKGSKYLNYAKIRANAGTTGKDAGLYLLESVFVSNPQIRDFGNPAFNLEFPFNGQPGYTVGGRIGAPDLKPELTFTYEAGVDLGLFNNALNIEFTYYNATNKDQIVVVNLPSSSGYTSVVKNIGEISNKGYELSIKGSPVRNKRGVNLDLYFNFSKNNNIVEEVGGDIPELIIDQAPMYVNNGSMNLVAVKGKPFGTFKGTSYQRDPLGNIIVDASGIPLLSDEDEYFGSYQPKFMLNTGGTISWKGLSLTATFDIKRGGQFVSFTKLNTEGNGSASTTVGADGTRTPFVVPGSVVDDGDGGYEPNTTPVAYSNYFGNRPASEYLVDASYVKLRELSLSYSLPKKFLGNSPITGFSIGFSGRNLMFWLPDSNTFTDPEVGGVGQNTNSQGIESIVTPSSRSFGFDIKLTF